MASECNRCYVASTGPLWLALLVAQSRRDQPCEKHREEDPMTTTPETPEQIVAAAFTASREPEYKIAEPQDAEDAAIAVAALRAHGLLSEGAPSEVQVEAAAKAIEKIPHIVWNSPTRQDSMTLARAALVAAQGVANMLREPEKCRPVTNVPGNKPYCPTHQPYTGEWPCEHAELDGVSEAAQGAAPQAESSPTSSYISPSLPGMIRNLWKSDPSENSVRTALKLAGDLIQELIDLRAAPVLPSSGVDEDALTAAGAAPQELSVHANPLATSGERVRNQTDSSHVALSSPLVLDPEKVAEVIGNAEAEWQRATGPETRIDRIARALCEAAKRGELT